MSSSKKDILDALACDSSADGCDPDWRASVLANADPADLHTVNDWLKEKNVLPKEIETRVRRDGKI